MESSGLRYLYNNFTSSINDTSHGKGFRAFVNSSIGKAYFNSDNKEEEGNTVQEMSKLKRYFVFVASDIVVRLAWTFLN